MATRELMGLGTIAYAIYTPRFFKKEVGYTISIYPHWHYSKNDLYLF